MLRRRARAGPGREGQRNHITCALRAFLRLEQHHLVTGLSWWSAKLGIIREAIRAYRAVPRYTLPPTA